MSISLEEVRELSHKNSKNRNDKFMADMKADGLKYVSNVDPQVYGKKGKMYHKKGEPNEHTTEQPFYYVYDFSVEGVYDVEVGYDDGMDI